MEQRIAAEQTPSGPRAPIHVPWGPREAALGVGVLIAATLLAVGVLALLVLPLNVDSAPVWAILLSTLVLQAGMAGAAYALGPTRGRAVGLLFGARRLSTMALLGWGLAAFLGSAAANTVYTEIVARVSNDLVPLPLPVELVVDQLAIPTFIVVVLIGPLVEETFFRGFLFAGLLQRWGFWGAAGGSGAVFAATHMDLTLVVPIFLSGIVFAWVYWRTGSLRPAVLAHTAQNAIALGLTA